MSFGDHLEELRLRLILALAAPIPLAIIAFFFSDWIIEWLLRPLHRAQLANGLQPATQLLTVAEYLILQLKLSIILALVLSAPWVLYQAWQFIKPGLYQHERRFVYLLIPGSAILIAAGIALLYYAMLPLMLQVLVSAPGKGPAAAAPGDPRIDSIIASQPSISLRVTAPASPQPGDIWMIWPEMDVFAAVPKDGATDEIDVVPVPKARTATMEQNFRLSWYINFVLLLMLAMTIAVQMPLVVLLLGWMGLVSREYLKRQRKYALMGCAVLAAVITPTPDAFSMLVMLVPLYGLYELGILLLWLAPASKVAEGRVLSLKRADYSVARGAGTAESSRTVESGTITADNIDAPAPRGDRPEDVA
jgi:sec-independent protein translocase protein TatC